jgi:hypothetical protein
MYRSYSRRTGTPWATRPAETARDWQVAARAVTCRRGRRVLTPDCLDLCGRPAPEILADEVPPENPLLLLVREAHDVVSFGIAFRLSTSWYRPVRVNKWPDLATARTRPFREHGEGWQHEARPLTSE